MMFFEPWKKITAKLQYYPSNSPFRIKGEISTFHDEHKLKEFITTKPVLQKIVKGILHTEEEGRHCQKSDIKIDVPMYTFEI
jgi:hypothetical protein